MARCIDDLIKAANGAITRKEADRIIIEVERRFREKFPKTTPDGRAMWTETGEKSREQLMVEAAQEAFDARVKQKERFVRKQQLQVESANRLQIQIARNGNGNKGLTRLIDTQLSGRIKAGTEQYLAEIYRGLEPFLDKSPFMRKLTPDDELAVARAIMDPDIIKKVGHDPDKATPAERLAYAFRTVENRVIARKNEAGANIQYLQGHLPQQWNAKDVRFYGLGARDKAEFLNPWLSPERRNRLQAKAQEAWTDFMMERIDRSKYANPDTGGLLDDGELRDVFRSVWRTIATNGLVKDVEVAGEKPALADILGAHRDIHFRDAEGFLDANRAFGAKGLFEAMVGNTRRHATDIAMMETFGPDTDAGFETGTRYAQQAQAEETMDGTKGRRRNEVMYQELTGVANMPTEERFALISSFMQATRNYISAAKLGMLPLSMVSDFAIFRTVAQSDGFGAGETIRMMLKMLNPLDEADRVLARRHAIFTQSVVNDVLMRYGAEQGAGFSRKVADFTVRYSGAEFLHNSLKQAFQLLIGSHTHDFRDTAFDALEPRYKRMLERYGIDEENWNIIRTAEPVEIAGQNVVTPWTVARAHAPEQNLDPGFRSADLDKIGRQKVQEAAARFGAMLSEEGDTAMITPGLRTNATLKGATHPGEVTGELARSFALFKSFSFAMVQKIWPRIMEEGTAGGRAGMAAQFALAMMVTGAISIQLKEIAKGRNPRSMADPGFWGAALLQSGGMGIFGDFLLQDANRFGGGLADTIAGPVVGLANDVRKLTVGNAETAWEGKHDPNFIPEAIQFAKNYAPAMNLWYTRLALDHLLFFHAQEAANPGYLRRMRRKVERENDQTFWYAPEDNMPGGAPDVSELFKRKL
ncbi:MAG TPA: hypothetical protein VI298_08730 [Geobacteraceae bacterium]